MSLPFSQLGLQVSIAALVSAFVLAACDGGNNPPPNGGSPATPTGLSAVAGNGEVTLSWDANSEEDLSHYNVYQGTSSGSLSKVTEVSAGTESITVTGLINATTYYFAIDAEDADGDASDLTAEIEATPLDTEVPFGGYMVLDSDNGDYIEIPHDAALNPTDAITLEGWVRFNTIECSSLIGKNWTEAFWVGPCLELESLVAGDSGTDYVEGEFPLDEWTHWAVTSDGTVRRHYINGELVGEAGESGALTTSADPVRIGSDVEYEDTPAASFDEFRLWNVARTQDQIQGTMNQAITSPTSGLVAVWSLDEDGSDALGNHHGTVLGAPVFEEDSTP